MTIKQTQVETGVDSFVFDANLDLNPLCRHHPRSRNVLCDIFRDLQNANCFYSHVYRLDVTWSTKKPNTMNNSTNGSKPFSLSESALIGWCLGYGLVDVFILISNTVAIVIFTRSNLLRKLTNYYLLSLSVADMLVGCVSVPMYIYTLTFLTTNEKIGQTSRDLYLTVDIFTGFASIFALTTIALERLYSVVLPSWHHTTKAYVYLILIVAIWFFAGVLAMLRLLFSYYVNKTMESVFYVSTMGALFSSLGIICIAYICIAIKVRMRINEKTKKVIEKNRKLAVTLSIVTLIFVITWLPFYLLNIAHRFCTEKCDTKVPLGIVLFSKLLQYCNSFINPIIYTFKIPDFRIALLRLMGKTVHRQPSTALISLRDSKKRSDKKKSKQNGNGKSQWEW